MDSWILFLLIQEHVFQNLSALQLSDPQEIVNAFKQAEREELVNMREAREKNRSKNKGEVVLECELCLDRLSPGTER